MSEIRTCEEYVLAELQEVRERNLQLQIQNDQLIKDIAKLQDDLTFITSVFEVQIRHYNATAWIAVDSNVFLGSAEYDRVVKLFNLDDSSEDSMEQ